MTELKSKRSLVGFGVLPLVGVWVGNFVGSTVGGRVGLLVGVDVGWGVDPGVSAFVGCGVGGEVEIGDPPLQEQAPQTSGNSSTLTFVHASSSVDNCPIRLLV